MSDKRYYLCQVNVSLCIEKIDHPIMASFVEQLDEINALADVSPGFVWRLQSESGNATDIQVFDDPRIIMNMSVWESIDSLHQYTYKTMHAKVMANRKAWFLPFDGPHMALWWIEADTLPTPDDAKQRLEFLKQHGPSPFAFTFKQPYPQPNILNELAQNYFQKPYKTCA